MFGMVFQNMKGFMPIYNFENNKLVKVDETSFSSEGILERSHL
jgi:hypothetical protein